MLVWLSVTSAYIYNVLGGKGENLVLWAGNKSLSRKSIIGVKEMRTCQVTNIYSRTTVASFRADLTPGTPYLNDPKQYLVQP